MGPTFPASTADRDPTPIFSQADKASKPQLPRAINNYQETWPLDQSTRGIPFPWATSYLHIAGRRKREGEDATNQPLDGRLLSRPLIGQIVCDILDMQVKTSGL